MALTYRTEPRARSIRAAGVNSVMSTIILRMLAIGEADRCERLVLALSCRWQLVIGMAATHPLSVIDKRLGRRTRSVNAKTPTFDPFPDLFANPTIQSRPAELGERLDASASRVSPTTISSP